GVVEGRVRPLLVTRAERGMAPAQREPASVVLAQRAVARRPGEGVVEPRGDERRRGVRVGDRPLPPEPTELLEASTPHPLGQLPIEERREEMERRRLAVLLAHEKERDGGAAKSNPAANFTAPNGHSVLRRAARAR